MSNPNSRFGAGGYGQGTYGSAPLALLEIDYYLNLFTSQYANSTRMNDWMTVVFQMCIDIQSCLESFVLAFDIDYASGAQLDLLGANIGVNRMVSFQPSNGVSPVLTDKDYRTLIKATKAKNVWNGQSGSLQTIWNDLFPGGQIIIQDQQNMTANVILKGAFTSIVQDLINNDYIVPRPQGVLYNYIYSKLPLFGFGVNNSFVAGFASGSWG